MSYRAPLSDLRFLMTELFDLAALSATDRFAEATPDLIDSALTEAGRLCEEVIAPLQRAGDQNPARLENGVVRTPPGFAAGHRALAEGGWIAVSAPQEHGGLGLPMMMTTAINEMVAAACAALQPQILLTQGQIEALDHHGTDAQKALYLPHLIGGDWTGTMNLTEPQAGTDLGALRARAMPNGDGSYAVTGQKIYITWGDNDFSDNVSHLVLARLPDAAPGPKGISLFLVPKRLPDADGRPGAANRLRVVSLEHKLGLHGSPTAVMEYDGATGWLVGAPHGGLAAMFTMMNNARLGVGAQGVGVAEAAYQKALAYALDRRQGQPLRDGGSGAIVDHADVRRMLAAMKADIFAARALCLACARAIDAAAATGSAEDAARAALLTPLAKSFGSETGIAVADAAIQVHGGMGYIEETGAAQYLRDVRVAAIYEGTNGIQAIDLVGRKLADEGAAAFALLDEVEDAAEAARGDRPGLAEAVWNAAESLRETTEWMLAQDAETRQAGAVAYQRAFARVLGGHFHLAAAAHGGHRAPLADLYIRRLLPEHASLLVEAQAGAEALFALSDDELAA